MTQAPELAEHPAARPGAETHVAMIVARLIVGGVFVWLSLAKIDNPHAFLKLLHQYQLPLIDSTPVLLNTLAVVLPWVELICGILFIIGFWLRGAAVLLLVLLIAFTAAVAYRAIGVYHSETIAFCSIKFDCGCGGGAEIPVCDKLRENTALIGLALIATVSRSRWLALDALFARRADD